MSHNILLLIHIYFCLVEVIATGENVFRGFAVQSRLSTSAFDSDAAFSGGFDNVNSDPLWQLIACTGVSYHVQIVHRAAISRQTH